MAMTVNTSGLISSSGFDVQALVDQMITAAQAPEQIWKNQQANLNSQVTALNGLSSKLAALNTSVTDLNDVLGAFAQRTATSSDEMLAKADATASAAVGQHSVVVTSLASKALYYSTNSIATADTVISGGSLSLTRGATTRQISIDSSNNTLAKIAELINGYSMGVTASVITDTSGAKLLIASSAPGTVNDFTLSVTSDSALAFKQSSSAGNAAATIDGVPLSSATNQFDNVLPGLTLTLTGEAPDTPVLISVSADTGRTSQAIMNFVNTYNSLTKAINEQFAYDQSLGTAGPLAADSAVRTLQQQLLQTIGTTKVASSATPTLHSLGITMNDDGTLSVDSSTLSSALESQFSAVSAFFRDSESGFATNLSRVMNGLTDSVNGPLVIDLRGIRDTQTVLANTISDFDDRISFKRQQLVDQFSQINAILQSLPTTLNEIDAMLGTLNTGSSSKK